MPLLASWVSCASFVWSSDHRSSQQRFLAGPLQHLMLLCCVKWKRREKGEKRGSEGKKRKKGEREKGEERVRKKRKREEAERKRKNGERRGKGGVNNNNCCALSCLGFASCRCQLSQNGKSTQPGEPFTPSFWSSFVITLLHSLALGSFTFLTASPFNLLSC